METKKIILAGGTGALGSILTPFLAQRGFQVLILTRHPTNPHHIPWNGRTLGPWTAQLESAAALINLAGRSVNCRYTTRNCRRIMDSRILSTHTLGLAIAACRQPPRLWLNSSTATIYKHTYGPAWDESGLTGATPEARDAFSIDVARAWEGAFFAGAPVPHTRKIALRTAIVLSRQPHTIIPILARLARLRLGGRMDTGAQWVSWIHALDFCRAIEWLLTRDLSGIVNLAAPNPITNADLMRSIRQTCGARLGLPATRWMLELGALILRTETELIIKSRRITPARLLASGFTFQYPELLPALADLLQPAPLTPAQPLATPSIH